ncbi:MAG: cell wall-binding repeat-containing protein [Clostridium sp.]|uniref:cell wall-binding repeat-containing protein n=1 Tax=Clostridium sp. TaxID=1506 RepID=UPI0025BB1922|nr:cell wall-binding repeat-containing protein [Clostridium sp.]MCH3964255.1 cell wall-binding repeat-containing protein [Clostridium sp.]MCI1715435.1 cell wall-binding repeat-containing protein [Clostridium sp.]MCI1799774.1 cell wall-binding repeat-containing protein [Clostridium sp.]MCI1813618.1 cell wall-binding repeat-containing protein [Clostridium sp.]MCI1870591.1 cell wall-binding repeat-containing protein [Clostridium sp.]
MNNLKMPGVLRSRKLALLVAAAAIAGVLSTTKAYAAPSVERYGGIDRYETAAKVCDAGWNTDTKYAVLANGENYPDALSAAPLAKKYDAPILLTGAGTLSPYTSSELTRLNVKNVFIVGGKGVVSQSIEDSLAARNIKVTRIGGDDRYETALKVAAKVGKSGEVALVNGNDFRDGMTIASIAALKEMPIILTGGNYMPASVKKYLGNGSKMDQIYVVGDSNTISDSVINGLSNVKRIGSGNSYSKNVGVIQAFQNEVDTGTLYIASARDFPDSLGASALAPKTSSPILFVDSPLDEATSNFLKTHIVNDLKVLGGTGAVSYEAESIAKSLSLGVGNTDNITDTIWQNEKYTPRETIVITATDGTKKEMPVEWNLTKVNTTKPGIYTFTGTVKGTDEKVYATLTVKPLPYKIDDIEKTAASRNSFSLPTTVPAQMTDGTTSQVAVSWDYGTQSGNKPGVYVFYGAVDKYSKKVKLTLTVTDSGSTTKTIKTINNIKKTVSNKSDYSLPTKIPAIMTDGSTENVSVTWGPENDYAEGVYTYEGTVSGYSKKVELMLVVTGEGGQDPNDPDYPDNPDNPDNPGDNDTDIQADPMYVIQGESYDLPKKVTNPSTKKSFKIDSWSTKSIDVNGIDSEDYDDCSVTIINFEGIINGSDKKAGITVYIKPRIVSVYQPDLIININAEDYAGQEYKLPDTIRVVTADGKIKIAKVTSWDKPYVNINTPQTYYIKGTVEYFANPILVNLTVN